MISLQEFKQYVKSTPSLRDELLDRTKKQLEKREINYSDSSRLIDACCTPKRFVDAEFARWCSDHNTKWNDSNFFVNSDVTTLSNCCRLLSSTSKLDVFQKGDIDINKLDEVLMQMYNEYGGCEH